MHDTGQLDELPKIEFDPEDVDFDVEERFRFCAAMRPWFQQHGYYPHLHSNKEDGSHHYSYPQTAFTGKHELPFAHLGGDEPQENEPAFTSRETVNARIHFAQGCEGRHLVIKLVKGDSEEYKITRFLGEQSSCVSGVVPILALLHYDCHWFVVMPRWSRGVGSPWFSTLAEILDLMRCLLEGLAFLHAHRIFHRDIRESNMLINHVPSDI